MNPHASDLGQRSSFSSSLLSDCNSQTIGDISSFASSRAFRHSLSIKPMADVESKLFAIFQIVTDWLKYAEAKHAGLLVASGADPAAILTVLYSSQSVSPNWQQWLLASLFCFLLGGIVSLLSFMPRVNRAHWTALMWGWGDVSELDNLLYFGDLSKYDAAQLVTSICERYSLTTTPKSEEIGEARDLAVQIVINSRITRVKLRLFTAALVCIVVAISLLLLRLLLGLF